MASVPSRICRKLKSEVKNVFEATLKNRSSAHFAPVTISFPIPEDQYEQVILALEKNQIGDARVQDCLVVDVCAPNCPALVRVTGTMANVDELDWLGKQLESFDRYEPVSSTHLDVYKRQDYNSSMKVCNTHSHTNSIQP